MDKKERKRILKQRFFDFGVMLSDPPNIGFILQCKYVDTGKVKQEDFNKIWFLDRGDIFHRKFTSVMLELLSKSNSDEYAQIMTYIDKYFDSRNLFLKNRRYINTSKIKTFDDFINQMKKIEA